MKAATATQEQVQTLPEFQSTPPVKAATAVVTAALTAHRISIHAAREGGDSGRGLVEWDAVISIHAAREGGDNYDKNICKACKISIHAAREGGDGGCRKMLPPILTFQSTPPVKAATLFIVCVVGIALYFNPRRP